MIHVNHVYRTSDEVNWLLAPDWANFYTIDSDGERWWWENKPKSSFNEFGIFCWDSKDGKAEQAAGFGLDDYWYYVYIQSPILKTNRIYDNHKYLLINDSKPNSTWFIIFKETYDREYEELISYYRASDAVEHLWNLVKNSKN